MGVRNDVWRCFHSREPRATCWFQNPHPSPSLRGGGFVSLSGAVCKPRALYLARTAGHRPQAIGHLPPFLHPSQAGLLVHVGLREPVQTGAVSVALETSGKMMAMQSPKRDFRNGPGPGFRRGDEGRCSWRRGTRMRRSNPIPNGTNPPTSRELRGFQLRRAEPAGCWALRRRIAGAFLQKR